MTTITDENLSDVIQAEVLIDKVTFFNVYSGYVLWVWPLLEPLMLTRINLIHNKGLFISDIVIRKCYIQYYKKQSNGSCRCHMNVVAKKVQCFPLKSKIETFKQTTGTPKFYLRIWVNVISLFPPTIKT